MRRALRIAKKLMEFAGHYRSLAITYRQSHPLAFTATATLSRHLGDKNLYTGGANSAAFTLNSNASDLLQNSPVPLHTSSSYHNGSGYASSAQCSPTGTPSTGMHKLATPKVAAGRYVHNPYAQSPVTAQAQV